MKTKGIILLVLIILSVVLYLLFARNPQIKGRYIARENSKHVIELKGPGEFSGEYVYYLNNKVVNTGNWWYCKGTWDEIEFDNWIDQGLYNNVVDTTTSIMFVLFDGKKLEFHPDLYEDDFIKE